MAQLKAWRTDSSSTAYSSRLPRLRYKPLAGEFHIIVDGSTAVLEAGRQMICDFANYYEGELSYDPFDISRMVLRGGAKPLPPFSGDEGYDGGIKLAVMVQSQGRCELLATQATTINALDRLYDSWVMSPEAAQGQLPLYELQAPRSFTIPQGQTLFAPILVAIGWVARDGLKFGPRLTPLPRPMAAIEVTTASPRLETDHVFETVARTGEAMPPDAMAVKAAPRGKATDLVFAGDLDDEVPF
jgi:hypothetical protein